MFNRETDVQPWNTAYIPAQHKAIATQQVGYDQTGKSAGQRRKLQQHSQYHFPDGPTWLQRHAEDNNEWVYRLTQDRTKEEDPWKERPEKLDLFQVHVAWCED